MKYNLYIVHTLTQIHLNDAEDRINKTIFSRFLHNFHQTAWVLIPVHTEDNAIHGYHSPFYPISKSYVLKKKTTKKKMRRIVSQRQSCLSIVLSKHAQLIMSRKFLQSTAVLSVLFPTPQHKVMHALTGHTRRLAGVVDTESYIVQTD